MSELIFVIPAALVWMALLLMPWRPGSTHECLESKGVAPGDLSDVTVLVPARNEAMHIENTLQALAKQGSGLQVVLIDDQSTDETAVKAEKANGVILRIVQGEPLPADWTGKLWALHQGFKYVATPITVLLDADISLKPGLLVALKNKMDTESAQLVSLMAKLRMHTLWEKLLLPAFIYYFKLLYPFALSNNPRFTRVAAAAGGCVMLETRVLREIGGFESLCNALIDDCALAKQVKSLGYKTWIGLTHSVISTRAYGFSKIWHMVSRTAFTQLRYSWTLLILTTVVFVSLYAIPVLGISLGETSVRLLSLVAITAMLLSYLPILRFYMRSPLWLTLLPLVALLYLGMTWHSAFCHWFGEGVLWRGRRYKEAMTAGSTNASV